MEKITDILLRSVEDENGRKYGRVFDFRSYGDPEHGITSSARPIDALLCGTTGWLQELGFRPKNIRTVQWAEIVEIKKNKIIIKSQTEGPNK